jgi:diaminopimelate epimerase
MGAFARDSRAAIVLLSEVAAMRFVKMHGLGNDYVFVDCFAQRLDDVDLAALARRLSDRHRGVGGDGLILIGPSEQADVGMVIYNADGSRAEMCGNGIRCVAKYAYERGLVGRRVQEAGRRSGRASMTVQADAGVRAVEVLVGCDGKRVESVRVDMGRPKLEPSEIPTTLPGPVVVDRDVEISGRRYRLTCVSLGNPHAVVFVDDVRAVALAVEGPAIETAEIFPRRTNVHFVQVEARDEVTMVTWERGSGPTQACGTGASAVCVAGSLTGRTVRQIRVNLPGGQLQIHWADDEHVHMTGPAEEVFTGEWPV